MKNEWNWTTVAAVLGVAMILWNASADYSRLEAMVLQNENKNADWRAAHAVHHQDQMATTLSVRATVNERLNAVEEKTDVLDNLSYRMAMQEQASKTLGEATGDLKQSLSNVTGDIKIIREILTRMEGARTTK